MNCKTAIRARPAPARRAVLARADPTAPGPVPAEGMARMAPVNPDIRKDEAKVVDQMKASELGKKARFRGSPSAATSAARVGAAVRQVNANAV